MAFKPGQSGNPAGRKKGVPNKVTLETRKWLTNFLDKNRKQIQKDWQNLDPKDRIVLFERLLKYSLPVLQATNLNVTNEIDGLSTEQVDDLFSRITNPEQ